MVTHKEISNYVGANRVRIAFGKDDQIDNIKVTKPIQFDDEIAGHTTFEYKQVSTEHALVKAYESDPKGKPINAHEPNVYLVDIEEMDKFLAHFPKAPTKEEKTKQRIEELSLEKKRERSKFVLPENGVPNSLVKLDNSPQQIVKGLQERYGSQKAIQKVLEHSNANSIREGHIVHTHLVLQKAEKDLFSGGRGQN